MCVDSIQICDNDSGSSNIIIICVISLCICCCVVRFVSEYINVDAGSEQVLHNESFFFNITLFLSYFQLTFIHFNTEQ